MARIITRELADRIVNKLGGVTKKKSNAHDLVEIHIDGKVVATFGLRRGSNREQGHDHIPGQIYTSPHDARELAICNISREEWIAGLREKGMIE